MWFVNIIIREPVMYMFKLEIRILWGFYLIHFFIFILYCRRNNICIEETAGEEVKIQ